MTIERLIFENFSKKDWYWHFFEFIMFVHWLFVQLGFETSIDNFEQISFTPRGSKFALVDPN